ncbi:MAG: helix-turn-helix transcriptional regulator [Methanobrevibacter millerae]|uniref:Helix-turn-helix transcriptional regulator n=1 Tax=Methanobrevibacter millerae TaxID=230361 RepID=A0A8T3VAB8_9EURY|nr:AraC family transcriptional regulator [Methanobrevibacter millerae]MBE6504998.1 helix-turn-helix transcriptional regulator [Methanobrevibacter millerae]
MNENMYDLFGDVFIPDFTIAGENFKKTIDLGEYGKLETYSLFPGVILAFIDINLENYDDVFIESELPSRLLEINHCASGRYAYTVGDDKIIYFGKGDLCISIHELTKTLPDFPLGFYNGIEIFIDVDVANDYIKNYLPDFDLIDFYEELEKSHAYILLRSNEKIDHVIGEIYDVDERIKRDYFKLKCIELLLFFSITDLIPNEGISLSKKQVGIVENVKKDLILDLGSKITIDDLASKYGISKTSLKNCFKEVYGKPIFKWRKEYKLDYACKLIKEEKYSISEISKMVGYSSPSKFSQAFKEYVGCTPSQYNQ